MTKRLLIVLTVLFPFGAHAGQITLDGALSQKGTWDSNPLMLTENEKELYGSTTSAGISWENETPLVALDVKGRVEQNFFNLSKFNSTDFYGNLGLSKKIEAWQASLKSNVSYDTTRTSEISTFGQDVGSVRRLNYGLAPEIKWSATEKVGLGLSGAYAQTDYDSRTLTDYYTASITPSTSYRFTPAHTGLLSVQYRRYKASNTQNTRVDSIDPAATWLIEWTPSLSGKLSAGADFSQTHQRNVTDPKWKWGAIYEAEIDYKGEQNQASFRLSRSQQPYANGNESLLTGVHFTGNQKVNEALSLNLSSSYQMANESGGSTLKNKLDAKAGVTYHALPDLDLKTSYRYRSEELYNRATTAQANIGLVEIVWRGAFDPSF